MKRRDFIAKSGAAALGAGIAGCAAGKPKKVALHKELAPFTRRPSGDMPTTELASTGIRVSRFSFGSHIRPDMRPFEKQREYIIREAFDLGINVFDVYDAELECYQYEPMGRFLKPIINDVNISISIRPGEGVTMEEEMERALRLFGRDHIDMVRCHAYGPDDQRWAAHWTYCEKLLRYKEKGVVRAVGIPIHDAANITQALETFPIDYVIFPYNFYHNIVWLGDQGEDFSSLPAMLRKKGVAVVTMKPFAGDWLAKPFDDIARSFTTDPEVKFAPAALRYVINSGIEADTTLAAMYNLDHLYENVDAYFNPAMSDVEKAMLDHIRSVAYQEAKRRLPGHYRWLENWAGRPDVKGVRSS